MSGINMVILLGSLGADPELRVTQNGQSVCKLRLATTTRYMDRNNAWKESTEWHSVVVWGAQGQACANHLRKGSKAMVEGEIHTRSYEKNGEKRYSTEIKAKAVHFMGSATPPGRVEHDQIPRDNRRRRQGQPERVGQSDFEYDQGGADGGMPPPGDDGF